MKKTWFLLAFCAMAAVLGMAGCFHPQSHSVVLRYCAWGGIEETKILQASAEEFKKAHPEVDVQMVRISWGDYVTKLLSQFAAGIAPDVLFIGDEQLTAFSLKGVFLDLKPYVKKDPSINLKDYFPGLIDHFTVNGALTVLPRNDGPVALIYYNKKAFDEAGVPYPKNDWNYLQFLETAKKLTKKDAQGKTVQYGFIDEWVDCDAWAYAFGGKIVDHLEKPTRCTLDSPEVIAGYQFRIDLSRKYGVSPDPAVLKEMGGLGSSDLFMNGTVAMFSSGTWPTPTLRLIKNFDWDAVEFPKGPKGIRNFGMHDGGFGVWKGTQHPELAWELVKYLSGPNGQRSIAATGLVMPALKSVARSSAFLDKQRPRSKGFLLDAVKYGHYQPFDTNYAEWSEMAGRAMDRVWTGDVPLEQALRKVTEEINAKFYNKPLR